MRHAQGSERAPIVKIMRKVLYAVIVHARACRPEECCGILLVTGADGVIDRVLRAENVERDHREWGYKLSHHTHIEAVRMECAGEARIAGYYHSHAVGLPVPSSRDASQAVAETTYLIVSLANEPPVPAAWRWTDDGFAGVPLEVKEDEENGFASPQA